jgi:hypothetical protein
MSFDFGEVFAAAVNEACNKNELDNTEKYVCCFHDFLLSKSHPSVAVIRSVFKMVPFTVDLG